MIFPTFGDCLSHTNPFTSWRGRSMERKERSQVPTHISVHYLHIFRFNLLQYTYPGIWKLNWLQIRPSVLRFLLPQNKIPRIYSVLHIIFFFLFPLNSPPNKTCRKKLSWLLPEENVIRESPAPPVAWLSRRCTEGRYLQTKSQPPPLGASIHKLLLKITRIRDKLRKTSRFKTASSLPFPLRQAACLWQTWVWESFHTLMCLGKM